MQRVIPVTFKQQYNTELQTDLPFQRDLLISSLDFRRLGLSVNFENAIKVGFRTKEARQFMLCRDRGRQCMRNESSGWCLNNLAVACRLVERQEALLSSTSSISSPIGLPAYQIFENLLPQ